MQIKIVKSTMPAYWYADWIGGVFDVVSKDTVDYHVISPMSNGEIWKVLKEDAEIVSEDDIEITLPKGVDKLDHLHSLIAASKGDVLIYWDRGSSAIKYQILMEDNDVEVGCVEDVHKVLEAQAVIESYKGMTKRY